jgi:hypothetical protein
MKTITLIIAILLAVPTYGISIVLWFPFVSFLGAKRAVTIGRVVVIASQDPSMNATSYGDISYTEIETFARNFGEIEHVQGSFIRFICSVGSDAYRVELTKGLGNTGFIAAELRL